MVDLRKVLEKNLLISIPSDQNLLETDFSDPGKVHDWRNYVPRSVIEIWSQLTPNERIIIFSNAEQLADQEEWD